MQKNNMFPCTNIRSKCQVSIIPLNGLLNIKYIPINCNNFLTIYTIPVLSQAFKQDGEVSQENNVIRQWLSWITKCNQFCRIVVYCSKMLYRFFKNRINDRSIWRHLRKVPYWGRNSVNIDESFFTRMWLYLFLTLHRERQKCSMWMLMSVKYRRPWSDAAHYARCLIRACDICPFIRHVFADDVTYNLNILIN